MQDDLKKVDYIEIWTLLANRYRRLAIWIETSIKWASSLRILCQNVFDNVGFPVYRHELVRTKSRLYIPHCISYLIAFHANHFVQCMDSHATPHPVYFTGCEVEQAR